MLVLTPLPAFQDNYIWTAANAEGEAVVVDPGEAGPVLEAAERGLKPVAILLTHHHPDHVGGVAALLERFQIPVYGPFDERIAQPIRQVRGGDKVSVPELGLQLEVLEIPGHTRSHIAFHGGGLLFSGDTLFSMGCGRLFEGSPAQMLASLDKLALLPVDTLVCCGHEYTLANGRFASAAEPENQARDSRMAEVSALRGRGEPSLPSTLGSELACNPFLRIDQPGLLRTLQDRGLTGNDRVDAFAALRSWKDGFQG